MMATITVWSKYPGHITNILGVTNILGNMGEHGKYHKISQIRDGARTDFEPI